MTRGIHLKQLKNADLTALGLEEGRLPGQASGAQTTNSRTGLLSETDPVLSQLVGEVREGLESTLDLLTQALGATGDEET